MYLNTLQPAPGAKQSRKRVGRGIGSGLGKTCGRGHKGQKSRSGGFHKIGFEGGQMPLQRRLPKVGFSSRIGRRVAEVRLHEIDKLDVDAINMAVLVNANIIPRDSLKAKLIASGEISRAVKIQGLGVTPGARSAIEAAGGSIEE